MDVPGDNPVPQHPGKHAYEPLQGPDHIRLLILHPASSTNAPLHVTFQQGKLWELQNHYEAVSYTWGEPKLTFPVHVEDDSTHVMVTENLDRALRRLRRRDRDRDLWADAVCINQSDNKEKETQIPLMLEIFSGAKKVLAWLDPGQDTTVEQRGMWNLDAGSRNQRVRSSFDISDTWPLQSDIEEISHFLRLPWFNRLWIVQEVVFNANVCLMCGDTKLPWTRFVAALSYLASRLHIADTSHFTTGLYNPDGLAPLDMPDFSSDSRQRIAAIFRIQELWSYYSLSGLTMQHRPNIEIAQLVHDFALYECTDPRDRIFAVYSMASDIGPMQFADEEDEEHFGNTYMDIDYSLDLRQTYEAFALATIKSGRPTSIVNALFARQHSPRPDDWPSWVPDWRILPEGPKCETLSSHAVRKGDHDYVPPHICALELRRPCGPGLTVKAVYSATTRKALKDRDVSHDTLLSVLFKLFTWRSNERRIARDHDLIDLLDAMVHGGEEKESVSRLRSRFMDLEQSPLGRDPENPALLDLEDSINEVEGALKNVSFFSFDAPYSERQMSGVTNTSPEIGDELFPFGQDDICHRSAIQNSGAIVVLILRPVGSIRVPPDGTLQPIYRLIGRAWTDCAIGSVTKLYNDGRPDSYTNTILHLA